MTRELSKSIEIAASRQAVWEAWTTDAGAQTFFAPGAHIECQPGGAYELYFMLDAPAGARGSEDCKVLAVAPEGRLEFSWNFPPHLPIRGELTRVIVTLKAIAEDRTKVRVLATDWQEGPAWDEGFLYFDRAWSLVLDRLRRRFESGPIDWEDPDPSPEKEP